MFVKYYSVALICLCLLACDSAVQQGNAMAQMQRLAEKYNIEIRAGAPADFFVEPYSSADADIAGAVMQPATGRAVLQALPAIDEALSAYPSGFFQHYSRAIFIAGNLTLDGAEAGGTYGKQWIILVADEQDPPESIYETARYGVHHEFSSFIWHQSSFSILAWQGLMPQNWQAADNNATALALADNTEVAFDQGFLSAYARSSMENDFNTYAEMAFLEPERLKQLARVHPVIAQKLGVLVRAYLQAWPAMKNTFQRLGLLEFAQQSVPKQLFKLNMPVPA